jgi:hypothetical protein
MATDDQMSVIHEDPEQFRDLVQLNRQEYELRRLDHERQVEHDRMAHAYSMAALEKQGTATSEATKAGKSVVLWVLVFLSGVITVGAWLIYVGRSEPVLEVVKIVGTFLAGGATGWGVKTSTSKQDNG